MNENSSNNSSTAASQNSISADAISRRAYDIWEQEGRPENRDLQHWLRAEQDLQAEMSSRSGSSDVGASNSGTLRSTNVDTQPLATPRATRGTGKRSNTPAPFAGEQRATTRGTPASGRSAGK